MVGSSFAPCHWSSRSIHFLWHQSLERSRPAIIGAAPPTQSTVYCSALDHRGGRRRAPAAASSTATGLSRQGAVASAPFARWRRQSQSSRRRIDTVVAVADRNGSRGGVDAAVGSPPPWFGQPAASQSMAGHHNDGIPRAMRDPPAPPVHLMSLPLNSQLMSPRISPQVDCDLPDGSAAKRARTPALRRHTAAVGGIVCQPLPS